MFSCTELFSRSYFLNTALNSGMTERIIKNIPNASSGIVPAKTNESCLPTRMDMMTANTSIIGARTAVRMSIMNAFWMLEISVVRRVTSEVVEKLSMLEKLKPCTL